MNPIQSYSSRRTLSVKVIFEFLFKNLRHDNHNPQNVLIVAFTIWSLITAMECEEYQSIFF